LIFWATGSSSAESRNEAFISLSTHPAAITGNTRDASTKSYWKTILSELEIVQRTPGMPATVASLSSDLASLGIEPGMVLLAHTSLSSLGWVSGGAAAVILALEDVLGPDGTLIMPAHSSDLSDPREWQNPPVPETWWDTIRQTMPPFDADLTPTRGAGAIAETFRKQRGVLRSNHPQFSFAAWGANAAKVTANHELDHGLGETSPLARIYELDGRILLLGVGHESNTSLHLAEYRAAFEGKRSVTAGAPVMDGGKRVWAKSEDIDLNANDFEAIGKSFAQAKGAQSNGKVACADALLAVQWMEANRGKRDLREGQGEQR
jgi:aminoglycoside 3-N-acetyltransferase